MTSPLTPIRWAENASLVHDERDCITAVVLKVLDAKCKMDVSQQEAVLAIYDTVAHYCDGHFDEAVHRQIATARGQGTLPPGLKQQIHQLRLSAEAAIEKPSMKAFKARLRRELFQGGA